MPRAASHDTAIAERIRARRQLLGWSISYAADRAGLNKSTWSRIERGTTTADNRFTVAKIAEALRCPVADLTGLPPDPVSKDEAETGGSVYETMRAVISADLRYPSTTEPQPWPELERELDLVCELAAKCDYAAGANRLPNLLAGLHATAKGKDKEAALRGLVLAEEAAAFAVRFLGHPASACLVADRAQQAAEELEHPVMLGLAGWSRAHASFGCGLHDRGLLIAQQAAEELVQHLEVQHAPEVAGMLYLTQAFALHGLGRADDALAPVAEAEALAERTGDTDTFWLMFGPTNIKFWKIAMHTDGGEPGRALEIARNTNANAIPKVSRQWAFFSDTGRALAREGRDQEALRMLLAAERLAPQRMKEPLVVETVRGLLDRAKRGKGFVELRGLCSRLGVGD